MIHTRYFHDVVLRPHTAQFVIDNLPVMLLCIIALTYGGMENMPLGSLAIGVALLLLAVLTYRFLYLRRMLYSIGHELIVSKRGVLHRRVDYMELYRIVDFREHQSLLQQLFGLKTVSILSMDRSTPRLDIIGVRRCNDIVPLIRERVEYNKQRKGIYEITNH